MPPVTLGGVDLSTTEMVDRINVQFHQRGLRRRAAWQPGGGGVSAARGVEAASHGVVANLADGQALVSLKLKKPVDAGVGADIRRCN